MPKKKVIFVACGCGVATSEMAAYKIRKLLDQRKLDKLAEVVVVDFRRLKNICDQCDILVNIAKANDKNEYPVPVVDGIAFLTGRDLDPIMDELEGLIRN